MQNFKLFSIVFDFIRKGCRQFYHHFHTKSFTLFYMKYVNRKNITNTAINWRNKFNLDKKIIRQNFLIWNSGITLFGNFKKCTLPVKLNFQIMHARSLNMCKIEIVIFRLKIWFNFDLLHSLFHGSSMHYSGNTTW